MAQYDGSIRINTQINTKNAEISLSTLENRIVKTSDKIASLRSKMDAMKDAKIPTEQYKEITSDISKAEQELSKLLEKQIQMEREGKDSGVAWDRIVQKIQATREYIDYANSELHELVDSGNAFTIGNPEEEAKLSQQLQYEESSLSDMLEKRELLNSKIQAQADEEKRLAKIKENATVADQELVELLERRRELLREIKDLEKAGVTEGYQEYDTALADLSDIQGQINSIRDMREESTETRNSYVRLGDAVRQAFKTMARGLVDIPIVAVKTGIRGLTTAFQKLGSVAKNVALKSFKILGNSIKGALSKAGSLIGNMVSKLKTLGSTAKKSFSTVNKSAKKTGGLMSTIASRFKGIALSLLLFNWITKAFNGTVKAIKDGFGNLYKDNERFKNSVDDLKASVLTLKNAFAADFRPLVDVAIPYIQMASDKMAELLNKVGQFTAAITGQKTYTKAIKQTADAFKEAEKSAEGYLSPLDEINKYSDGKSNNEEDQTGIMFEEVPIEQKFKDMAEKVKDVFKDLFAPIKKAWDKEGEFVIDSWKYGLKEIGKLAKDIGRDFLKVWQQPETVAMLQDILHIFGDIGLIVGNLAAKFREAWNANNVGLHILENIRDIFAVIIRNIREAADYTVEWTKTIDFTPLLQGVERLTASLVPFFDFLSGTLADFYTQFLLPLASWTLSEVGIPRLLNILSDFMESVNWQGLRDALKNLYGALEPYAEAIGTGLIDFIERMKEYGVEFLNFLPEHIQAAADSLRNNNLPGAFEEFGTICGEAVKTAFNMMREAIRSIPWGEIGTYIGSFLNGIDWSGVSEAFFGRFVDLLNGLVEGIYNLIITTDWVSIGRQIGTSFSNALMEIDWAGAGRTLSEAFKAFFTFVYEAIEAVDWYGVGEKAKEFIVNIDWNGVADTFFRAIGAIFGGFAAFLWGIIEEAWNSVVQWWRDTAYEDGEFTIQGLLDGIVDALSTIGNWIYDHIFIPFWNGITSAFGIHSPSTKMAEIGKYVIEGLLNGLKNTWSSITSWIEDKVNWIIDKFKGVGEKIKGTFSGGGDSGSSGRSANYTTRSISSPYASIPAFAKLADVEIPGYATGQVIPRTMRQHLAILGDNNNETEVVSPLSTIKQANRESLLEVLSELGLTGNKGNSNSQTIIIKQYLDGKQVAESVVKEGKVQQMATGNNMFLLGTT